ncbi:MAG: hypothetical protein OXR66_02090 [Candidatus Woesearchaeota archaeon]|nr:hypothetical protein [Candidatus Woesearchaeota archaeon]
MTQKPLKIPEGVRREDLEVVAYAQVLRDRGHGRGKRYDAGLEHLRPLASLVEEQLARPYARNRF